MIVQIIMKTMCIALVEQEEQGIKDMLTLSSCRLVIYQLYVTDRIFKSVEIYILHFISF